MIDVLLGNPRASYDIGPSGLPRSSPGSTLDKISITGGKFVIASPSFAIGKKEKPHLDSLLQLPWIHSKYFILYDVDDKRAWLVDGTNTLVRLVRASLHNGDRGNLHPLFDPTEFEQKNVNKYGRHGALAVLMDLVNLDLVLDEQQEEKEMQDSTTIDATKEVQASVAEVTHRSYYTFRDRVSDILDKLGSIIEYQMDVESQTIIRPPREHEGYDFMDIALDRDSAYPRALKIGKTE